MVLVLVVVVVVLPLPLPPQTLPYADEAGSLSARLAVGKRVEVGFLGRLATADVAAVWLGRGGGGGWAGGVGPFGGLLLLAAGGGGGTAGVVGGREALALGAVRGEDLAGGWYWVLFGVDEEVLRGEVVG